MKTKLTNSLILSIAFVFAFTFSKAQTPQQLIHFWDFNNTLPASGAGGDSLGTPYSYLNTRAIDSANKSMTLYTDYTKIPSSNPRIIAIRPKAIQSHCKLHDSIVDNGNGGSTYYSYDAYNYNYFNTSDSVNGNNYVRYRNPNMNSYMYFVAPTTGYKNIHFSFAITASSSKGARYNVFQYSTNGGATWDSIFSPIAVDTFTNARWATWKHDTLVVTNPNAPFKSQGVNNSLWEPVSIDLSAAVGVANNPQFMIRIRECAPTLAGTDSNSRGISGNDRYDNFAITGDSNTSNIVAYIVNRQNIGPCAGDSNGSARAYVMGGTPPYTFSWSNNCTNSHSAGGLLTDSAYGLKAGTYTLTVTDFNDNAAQAVVTLLQPSQVVPVISSAVNVACNGSNTGSVNTTTSGGTSPYIYSWSNGNTTANITGLSAGSYTLTVTDHFGCGGTVSVAITQPTVISISTSSTPVTCSSQGSASASPSGGTPYNSGPAYHYSWSNGGTTAIIFGLGVGTYSVTVTDSLGCSQTASVNVTSTSITASVSPVQNVSCNGGSNGTIISSVSGGITPYTYNWSNGATTTSISGLSAGSYTLTVTDHVGCNGSGSCVITEPAVLMDTIVSVTPASKVIHYWDFNQTPPIGGAGGDSLGTATNPLPADFTTLRSLNPHLTYSHPATSGILDNGAGPPAAYINDLHICGNDTASQGINNTFVRDRNPTQNAQFTWYIPTTGYQNITLDWALSASSVKGAQYLIFQYSTDGGSSWNKLTAANDTFTIGGGVHHPDTMLAINSVTKNSLWFPAHVDLSNIAAANNNPGLVFRVNYGGSNVTLTSGNDRWDNISVKGQEIPRVSCNGNNNGSAASLVTGGTGPFTYNWSTGATTDTVNNLVPGTNTVTVTDAHGCSTTASVTVINPPVLKDSVTVNNGCNNSNNGIATSMPSGGTGPYNWSWSNGRNTNIDTNLAPGTYTVTVTDIHGCTVTTSATITNPAALLANVTTINITCNGANNGSASSSPTGGTSPYTYQWSAGAGHSTNASVSGLTPGTDTLKVTDRNGCTSSAIVTITQPAILTANIGSSSPVGCNGGSNGSATANGSGGTSPYAFSWSNSATGSTATGLSAGTYSVTISDTNGCSATASVSITEPPVLTTSMSFTQTTCTGNTGTATTNPSGGTPSYTYLWSNGATAANITGLTAGTYSVVVTDQNSCSITDSVFVTASGGPRDSITNTVNVLCFGGNSGSATVGVSGGTSPYTYAWNNGETNATATGLSAGSYTVTVTDAGGCQTSATDVVGQSSQLRDSIINVGNESCYFDATGQATVGVTGGNTPYTYSWTSGSTSASAFSLSAGTYTVTVTDNLGCSITASVSITQPTQVRDSITSIYQGCIGQNNGNATLAAGGGTPGYTYNWSNGETGATATGLSAGTYTVTVKDAFGCTLFTNITISPDSVPNVKIRLGADSVICDTVKNLTLSPFGSPSGGTFSGPFVSSGIFHPKTAGNGTYTIKYVYTGGGGCTDSATAKIRVDSCHTNGVNEIAQTGNKITIYPNPSPGQFNITGLTVGSTIEIYDGIGKLLTSVKADRETISFSLDNKANGIYMVRIINNDGTSSVEQKVIKLK